MKKLSNICMLSMTLAVLAAIVVIAISSTDSLHAGRMNAVLGLLAVAVGLGIVGLTLHFITGKGAVSSQISGNESNQNVNELIQRIETLERMLTLQSETGPTSKELDPGFLAELENPSGESPSETNPAMAGEYTPVNGTAGIAPFSSNKLPKPESQSNPPPDDTAS